MSLSCATLPLPTWFIFRSFSAYLLCAKDVIKVGGIYDAAVEAISETDEAVGTIAKVAKEAGYVLAITPDHGNAEQMVNLETGAPHTAHTTNPVPFIVGYVLL
jgi:bisphosphoglycerate-independent phosphoglycerate mutase (AlkP superfamily)